MAEFTTVVQEGLRNNIADVHGNRAVGGALVVVGLRVNDGPTVMDSDPERRGGKKYERHWDDMPDPLAFATEAFYRTVYERQEVPPGHYFDCHVYQRYALNFSDLITLPEGEQPPFTGQSAELPMPQLLLRPYEGYILLGKPREGDASEDPRMVGVHSLIALPRRYGVVPECMAVEGDGGKLLVSGTRGQLRRYGAIGFFHMRQPQQV